MEKFIQDVRFALRKLAKSPGFALLSVATLALGIGANTAIFSVLNAVLLRPLPYPEPERLTYITSQFPGLGFDQFWISPPEFLELRDWNQSFESVGAFTARAANLGAEHPVRPVTAVVTDDLMTTLGVAPEIGRQFTRDDTVPGAEDVAILSHELWRSAFNGDRDIIGRRMKVDGVSTRIVGVMPSGYDVHDQKVELWLPLTIDPKDLPNRRGNHFLYVVGRLKRGVGLEQARNEVAALVVGWRDRAHARHAPNPQQHPLRVDDLQRDVVGNVRNALLVLQGAVVFVLLIACANLANLLLARADSRHREFAVRTALGAGRARLLRQFVTEGIVIAVMGGALGIAAAGIALRWLLTEYPDSIPRSSEVSLDWRVLAFTLLVAIVTGAIFGLAPLLHLRETALSNSLKDSGTRTTAGTARTHTRSALVVAEVALAVMLVAGASLLMRSFWNLLKVDAGFDRSRLTTFELVLPNASYPGAQRQVDTFDRLMQRISAIPGVASVTAMSGLPPMRQVDANDTDFEGVPRTPDGPAFNVDYYQFCTTSYFDTMKIPVVAGRGFTSPDAIGSPVIIVNEALAKRFYPKQDPIGRRMRVGGPKAPWLTIVGVAKDVKQGGVNVKAGTELYVLQEQSARLMDYASNDMNIVVRSSLPYGTLAPQLRSAVASMDASLPIVRMRTMEEVFQDSVERPRFLALLLGAFAALALVLAAVGTYGILSYIVTERRHEIGVRMALGADRATVLGMVLRQGLLLAGTGLIAGLLGSFLLNKALASLLFNITPSDPPTLAIVAAIIGAVALAACIVPAENATRTDPLTVLRE